MQRKRQVEGMLEAVDGKSAKATETSILVDQTQVDLLETLFKKAAFVGSMNRLIQQAGLSWTPTRLVALMAVGGAAGAMLGWIFRPLGFATLSVAGGALLFGFLPYFYVRVKRNKRMSEFEQQLPEALDFLARSMRAGHAFSVSLEMLGAESADPLGQEFRTLFNEQNLGAPLEVAFA